MKAVKEMKPLRTKSQGKELTVHPSYLCIGSLNFTLAREVGENSYIYLTKAQARRLAKYLLDFAAGAK